MQTADRLLIMSCSQRKRVYPDSLPATIRYDGPGFRVLRHYLKEQHQSAKQLDVFVLSAAYGLIPGPHLIAEYDQALTPQRAEDLRHEVLSRFAELVKVGYSELCLSMSQQYLGVLEGWQELVPSCTAVTITNGAQGTKLTQLKSWLWKDVAPRIDGEAAKQGDAVRRAPRPCGVARLRGVELYLTPAEVKARARVELADNPSGAGCFRYWYVIIDGARVSPKWLVSRLTGLPVSTFTSGEARHVLQRLGLHALSVLESADES